MFSGNPAPIDASPSILSRALAELRRRYRSLKQVARKIRLAVRHEIHAHYRRQAVLPNLVFYESFAGNGVLCNPEAIFRALHANPEFSHLTHVWALRSRRENRGILREFAGDKRVKFVTMRTAGYWRALARSGYLINNATFPTEFSKRVGQTYLNTWHGTPLKKMGYDIGDAATRVGNVIRNFLQADYLLAANPFMVDQMYEKAHLLHNIYRGRIIDEGYPRIDHQFLDESGIARMRDRVANAVGVELGERRILLYAPTWKGTNFNRPEDDIQELLDRVAELQRGIDSSKYVVLLKTHQVVHRYLSKIPGLRGVVLPNEIPTNSILAVTDVLVTDYSSIFFDFLPTGRPIAFLTPDIDDYAGYRGLYFEPREWPGSVVKSVPQLIEVIAAMDAYGVGDGIRSRHRSMLERFASREDGHATDRVIDIVFRGNTAGYRIQGATSDGRTPVLIHAGSMRPNGITSSLLNLLDNVDHDRFDVSVLFPYTRRRVIVDKQREMNPRVRQFARVGGMNGSKVEHLRRRLSWRRGDLRSHRTNPSQRRLWDDEWNRIFGSSRFDEVIDFSGYGPFFATLLLHAPDAERSIWLHNDLAADAHRATGGRKRQLRALNGIFTLYRDFDHLVSVSASLRDINRASLGSFADPARFSAARNLINADRVITNAAIELVDAVTDPLTGEVPAWAAGFRSRPGIRTFITVGRLSPEKNQRRLLEAFAVVHRVHPNTRLVIVGSGPLLAELERFAWDIGLVGSVIFTGHQRNPQAIMSASDCFVLSSDYEGQPMVLLEARTLGLPVVTVAFGSIRDAVDIGGGLVVDQSVDGLIDGMIAFLRGRVTTAPFDSDAYNREAMDEFYRAIGADRFPAC